jgi:hypothetical protein
VNALTSFAQAPRHSFLRSFQGAYLVANTQRKPFPDCTLEAKKCMGKQQWFLDHFLITGDPTFDNSSSSYTIRLFWNQ